MNSALDLGKAVRMDAIYLSLNSCVTASCRSVVWDGVRALRPVALALTQEAWEKLNDAT